MSPSKNRKLLVLLLVLLLSMGFLCFGALSAVLIIWLTGLLPEEVILDLMQTRSVNSDIFLTEGKSSFSLLQLRFLWSRIWSYPVSLLVIILFLFCMTGIAWLIWKIFQMMKHDELLLKRILSQPASGKDSITDLMADAASTKAAQTESITNSGLELDPEDENKGREAEDESFQILELQSAVQAHEIDWQKVMSLLRNTRRIEREQYENTLHQIRSQLTSLYFYLDELPEEKKELAEKMEAVLEAVNSLAKNGLRKSVYSHVRLDEMIRLCLSQRQSQIRKKRIEIDLQIPPLKLIGDSLWLVQIIETLIGNALDKAPDQSPLRIYASQQQNQIKIYFENQIETMQNQSIPENTEGRNSSMFERYYSQSEGHFGIGLDLADHIAREHKGFLEIVNSPVLMKKESSCLEKSHINYSWFVIRLVLPYSELESG